MTVMFILFGVSVFAEVLLHALFRRPGWRLPLIIVAILLANFASGSLCIMQLNLLTILIAVLSLYRSFNMVRVVKGRMNESYLRFATWRTSYLLIFTQIVLFVMWGLWYQTSVDRQIAWLIAAIAQLFVSLILWFSLNRRILHTRPGNIGKHYSDAQLPSITVAIPARNETQDLQLCLQSVLASNYPKLEVIVLDDCSQNKHTSEIIKSFAHSGVRFVQGEEPKPTWLAKNQAYDRLTQEASGEFIVFCGVDVRFERNSLRQLVTLMLNRRKSMVSVMPLLQIAQKPHLSVVQAMRYWWELVPPRRLFNRPAVLSSCWIIERKALKKTGGFAAITRAIVPEAYFAKALVQGDRYSFIRSNRNLMITSVKQRTEQTETAVRMRYPQVHRRPEQVALVAAAELGFLVMPYLVMLLGWRKPVTVASHIIATLTSLILTACFVRIARITRLSRLPYSLVGLPIIIFVDVLLLHRSMWQYEFSIVEWKDRNICIPVMHGISRNS